MQTPLPPTILIALMEATIETLTTIGNLRIESHPARPQNILAPAGVSGVMHVTGRLLGTVGIGMSVALAKHWVRQMLGKDGVTEAQAQDGVLELLNMIVGKASGKLELTPYPLTFDSPPVACEADSNEGWARDQGEEWVLPLTADDQPFALYLNLIEP